ncbi:MAG: hypothetical protein PHH14_04685 [Candidatus Margulisbacteria bacterium]|nr:hypothetical protein [Candidatus Margulisiibacteriota bacterium]
MLRYYTISLTGNIGRSKIGAMKIIFEVSEFDGQRRKRIIIKVMGD